MSIFVAYLDAAMNFDMAYTSDEGIYLKKKKTYIYMLLKQGEVKKYLEKIMNTKMLKFFQGHVIACSHVLTSYS